MFLFKPKKSAEAGEREVKVHRVVWVKRLSCMPFIFVTFIRGIFVVHRRFGKKLVDANVGGYSVQDP